MPYEPILDSRPSRKSLLDRQLLGLTIPFVSWQSPNFRVGDLPERARWYRLATPIQADPRSCVFYFNDHSPLYVSTESAPRMSSGFVRILKS
jgi:hypothetical protein